MLMACFWKRRAQKSGAKKSRTDYRRADFTSRKRPLHIFPVVVLIYSPNANFRISKEVGVLWSAGNDRGSALCMQALHYKGSFAKKFCTRLCRDFPFIRSKVLSSTRIFEIMLYCFRRRGYFLQKLKSSVSTSSIFFVISKLIKTINPVHKEWFSLAHGL